MNRNPSFILIVLLLIGCVPDVWSEAQLPLSKQQIENIGIAMTTPEMTREVPLVQAPARISIPPDQEYVVSAPYSGLVSSVKAALGEPVRKGQLLARINSPELLTLQRDLLNNSSELQLAGAKMRRDEMLLKEGVISQRRWQESRSQYTKYATLVNEAKQMLRIAGMSQTEIRQLLRTRRLSSTLNIHAPAAGVILEKKIVAGQRVDALTPLFRLAKLDKLWLDISVPQERVQAIDLNDEVKIKGSDIRARVTLIGRSVNPDNQSVLVRAVIERNDGSVRPGQKATVRLLKSAARPLFDLPVSALMRAGERSYVFVRVEGGFEARPVTVAGREGQSVTISEGLSPGQPVVVKGVAALKASWLELRGDQ
jgi:membrane fusion protein, heavy metal efflux system